MTIDLESKIYIQLQPTQKSTAVLLSYQKSLNNPTSRSVIVPPHALHLTVIHIGKVSRIIESVRVASDMDDEKIIRNIQTLVTQLQAITKLHEDKPFTLPPTHFSHLGRANNALVIEYEATPQLKQLHETSLGILKNFIASCGVTDVEAFMENDKNFKYALVLRPHITIAKGHTGSLPTDALFPLQAKIMDVLQK